MAGWIVAGVLYVLGFVLAVGSMNDEGPTKNEHVPFAVATALLWPLWAISNLCDL